MVLSPDGRRLYVSNRWDNTVSVVDVGAMRVERTFPVGDDPHSMSLDPGGAHLFVVNLSTNDLSVFETENFSETKRLPMGRAPFDLAMGPADEIYITDPEQGRVIVYNTEGVPLEAWGERGIGDGQFGKPLGIAIDKDGNVYVTDPYNTRVQKFGKNE